MTVADKKYKGFLWNKFICILTTYDNSVFTDFTYENPNRNLELGKVTEMAKRKFLARPIKPRSRKINKNVQ